MSVEAISWAFQQPIQHSSAKFVLVAMANHAGQDMLCWPSAAHLASQTSQDRKTVQANLLRLREWGYLVDTGERRGTTKQVIVYQLKTPENGPVTTPRTTPEVADNTTENGPVEHPQNRNTSTDERGPFFPPNRPVFPHKEAQFSPETGPKTGHGTIRNHQEPSRNPVEARKPTGTRLPDNWTPTPEDVEFCRTQRPDLSPQIVADRFRDYWAAQPGAKGRKLDWSATWRNWVRNERAPQRQAGPASQANIRRLNDRINGATHDDDHRIIDINDRPA